MPDGTRWSLPWTYSCRILGILISFLFYQIGCKAEEFRNLDLSSPLYTFSDGWTKGDEAYTTTNGSVMVSFKGSSFKISPSENPGASVEFWTDGQSWGRHQDGWQTQFTVNGTEDQDHQVMIQVNGASSSESYTFSGIGLLADNKTNTLVESSYMPSTLGANSTSVPADALVYDNTHECLKYSEEDWSNDWSEWTSYGRTSMRSRYPGSSLTVYFLGTDIWLFGPLGKDQGCQSMTTKLDSEIPVNSQLSSPSPLGMSETIYQKLLWQRTGLINTLHVLVVQCEQSGFDVDFIRIAGRSLPNCQQLTSLSPFDSKNGLTSFQIVFYILLGPFLFWVFMLCWMRCYFQTGNRSWRWMTLPSRVSEIASTTTANEELDTKSPLSSPKEKQSISPISTSTFLPTLRHSQLNPGQQVRVLPSQDAARDPERPAVAPSPHPTLTPFDQTNHPDVFQTHSSTGHHSTLSSSQLYPSQANPLPLAVPAPARRSKSGGFVDRTAFITQRPFSHPSSVSFHYGAATEMTEDSLQNLTGTVSYMPEVTEASPLRSPLEPIRAAPQNALQLLPQPPNPVITRPRYAPSPSRLPDWSPPPPSYLTEVNLPRRPFQLLSQDDLGLLVDRVAALRSRRNKERTLHLSGPAAEDPIEDSQQDIIEILAHRIIEADPGGHGRHAEG